MKDFQTKKSEKLIEGLKVDGKNIYMNLAASNMMQSAGFAKTIEMEDPEQADKLAQMIFTPDSYKLVSMLDLEDFIVVLDLATKVLDEQENTLTARFKRPE